MTAASTATRVMFTRLSLSQADHDAQAPIAAVLVQGLVYTLVAKVKLLKDDVMRLRACVKKSAAEDQLGGTVPKADPPTGCVPCSYSR